ncbi:MAG: aminomethyl-transferring glycine dehydrogenase subunit GcvPA [Firmicutes bacterium]|nr:aminomethyl-transferring glycine dehydrogenase subunit GcvPA [Bacillota bacterium]
MAYLPNTPEDRQRMLERMGIASTDQLFEDIPEEVRLKRPLNLPPALSEMELWDHLRELAGRNRPVTQYLSFLGGGAYEHFIPSVVGQIVSRSEFYTAYTPYQAEISQGVLQAIFEYQTMMCELTGLPVANASLYEGGTAAAEAMLLAVAHTRRNEVVVSTAVHPEFRQVLATYAAPRGIVLRQVPYKGGLTDLAAWEQVIGPQTAAVILQNPNFFGGIEDCREAFAVAHRAGALAVAIVNPFTLGVLAPPAEYGADVAVGDGQPLGNPLSFGGPYFGFMAVREELVRRLPGRLVGQTHDRQGRVGYVLTLQTREQHIRREKATSNICTNQALNALAATVYLAAVGPRGLRQLGELAVQKAHYAARRLAGIPGWRLRWEYPFFHEFVVASDDNPEELNARLLDYQIIGGLPLGEFYEELADSHLFCVTETKRKADIDRLVSVLEGLA